MDILNSRQLGREDLSEIRKMVALDTWVKSGHQKKKKKSRLKVRNVC